MGGNRGNGVRTHPHGGIDLTKTNRPHDLRKRLQRKVESDARFLNTRGMCSEQGKSRPIEL